MTTGVELIADGMQFRTSLKPEVQYLYGGKVFPRVDCSGWASFLLARHGIILPAGTAAQEAWAQRLGRQVKNPMEALVTAGVFLFGNRHCGFAVGNGNSLDMRSEKYDLEAYDATINFPFSSLRGYYIPGISYKPVDYLAVSYGSRNPVVGWVQQKLKDRKYSIVVDDDFGKLTKEIVARFQKDRGLVQDGVAGRITQKALGL